MKTYTEEKRIRPDVLTAAVYFAAVLVMVTVIISYRITGDKGAFFAAAPMSLCFLFYCAYVFAVQKAVYVMVRLRARRSQFLNAQANMRRTLQIFTLAGVFTGIIIISLSYTFATRVLGVERNFFLLIISGACMLFLGPQGTLKGYLQGIGYTRPIMMSDTIVAGVSMISGSIASGILYSYGLKVNALFHVDEFSSLYGAAGTMAGLLLGSIVGFILTIVSYNIRKGEIENFVKTGAPRYLDNRNDVLVGIRPIIVLYCTPAFMTFLDQTVYCLIIRLTGSEVDYIANYGRYFGRVIGLVCLIAVLCCIPFIKSWNMVMAKIERDEIESARERYKRLVRFSNLFYMPVALFSFALSGTIQTIVYGKSSEAAASLMLTGSVVIYFCCFAIFFSWLINHMGKSVLVLVTVAVGWIVHLVTLFVFLLVFKLDVLGILLSVLISLIVYDAMCIFFLSKMLRFRQEYVRTFFVPLICAAITGLVVFFINSLVVNLIGEVLTFILCAIVYWFVYMIMLIVLRGLRTNELKNVVFGNVFYGISSSIQKDR